MAFEKSIEEITAALNIDAEAKTENKKVDDNLEPEVRQPQASPTETRARASGWVPEDEWEGDPADWVDAKQFNIRGELMDRIKRQGKYLERSSQEINQLKKSLKELGDVNTKIAKVQYEKALKDLNRQKAEAITDGDSDKVAELEETIDELKESNPTPKGKKRVEEDDDDNETNNQPQQPPQELVDWIAKNSWYETDAVMHGAANALGDVFARNNPGVSLSEIINYVDVQMRQRFPESFKGGKKKQVRTSVEALDDDVPATTRVNSKSGFTQKDMSSEQKEFGKTFVESGAFKNMQEYVDQLAELGELPVQKKGK